MTLSPTDLLTKVDPQVFTAKFGCGLEGAQSLVEAKTLTISKLMTIMPPGTVDPRYMYNTKIQASKSHNVNSIILSPFLYNNTMYTMAGLVTTASALHFMVGRQNLFLHFYSSVDSCCLSHV